jgi:hypothetical protein
MIAMNLALVPFYGGYFERLMELQEIQGSNMSSAQVLEYLRDFAMAAIPIAGFSVLGSTIIQVVVIAAGWNHLVEEETTLIAILRKVFARAVWVALLQTILLIMIIGVGILGIAVLGGMLGGALMSGGTGGKVLGFLIVLIVLLAGFIGAIYLGVASVFRMHEVVCEDRGPWRGLISSMALVKGSWWRVLGLILVVAVLAGIGMVVIQSIIGLVVPSPPGDGVSAMIARVTDWRLAILNSIPTALFWLFFVNFLTLLYTDLRVRRGDFDTDDMVASDWSDAPIQVI